MSRSVNRLHRIAIVTHNLASGGGTATMTAFLYRVLSDSGRYHPEIISLATSASDTSSVLLRAPRSWKRGPLVHSLEWYGLPYRHVGAYFTEFEFQRYRPCFPLDYLLNEYDLVQFVTGTPPWACTASRLKQPVTLWTATTTWADRASRIQHMSLLWRGWRLLMTRCAQYYERQALRRVRFVFALSKYTLSAVRQWVAPQQVGLAVCGVDTQLFQPTSYNSPDNYILCVARFSDVRKNVRLLLHAYAQLARRQGMLPDLYLVGELPSKNMLQEIDALRVAHRVHLLGVKSGRELAALYQKARFFVLSSDEEGLGIVILEAMASGLPVVSTRCGGPETVVIDGETGFLTSVGSAQALADAMQRLLDDPGLRRRMGQAGRQRAEERFSLAAAGKVFLDKYEELLDTRGNWI